ncbi:MAG: metal ABC transporter substrate-binding protein [bacterium]
MKIILIGVVLLAQLTGMVCGAGVPPRTIVTTVYPLRLALLNIAGGVDGVSVVPLADSVTGCLHDYQLTTRDMATLSTADLLVVNGAGMESFLDAAILRRPGLRVINASEGIELLVVHGDTNAHVWVSPARYIRQVKTITEGLAQWDSGHADAYRANAARYIDRLESLKAKLDLQMSGITKRDIITFHEAFPYFADDFKLKVVAVIEREPGSEPSASEMASLIRLIRGSGVKALFVEPQYPAKVAAAIERETGAGIYTLDPVVSGPVSTNAYIDIMERNLAELVRALR